MEWTPMAKPFPFLLAPSQSATSAPAHIIHMANSMNTWLSVTLPTTPDCIQTGARSALGDSGCGGSSSSMRCRRTSIFHLTPVLLPPILPPLISNSSHQPPSDASFYFAADRKLAAECSNLVTPSKEGERGCTRNGAESWLAMRNWLVELKFYKHLYRSGGGGPHSVFSGPTSSSMTCVAFIRDTHLVVANAGDSRCVISRKRQVELYEDDFFVLACNGVWYVSIHGSPSVQRTHKCCAYTASNSEYCARLNSIQVFSDTNCNVIGGEANHLSGYSSVEHSVKIVDSVFMDHGDGSSIQGSMVCSNVKIQKTIRLEQALWRLQAVLSME